MTTTTTAAGAASARSLEAPSPSPSPSPSTLPTWKLYDNLHYSLRPQTASTTNNSKHLLSISSSSSKSRSRSSYHTRDLSSFSRTPSMEGSGGGARYRHVSLSDLDKALGEIKELRSELEHERRMRRKVEAANRALTREKEAAEERCRRLEEEVACLRREMERAAEERRMMRMAEAMREERVQMKLTEARMMMEDKMKEISSNEGGEGGGGVVVVVAATKGKLGEGRSTSTSSNDGSSTLTLVKKEVENPHIKRGIKGMEFPRGAMMMRGNKGGNGGGMGSSPSPSSREGRGGGQLGSLSNLECQRAQLRVLMRNKSPASSGMMMGAAQNLVM